MHCKLEAYVCVCLDLLDTLGLNASVCVYTVIALQHDPAFITCYYMGPQPAEMPLTLLRI